MLRFLQIGSLFVFVAVLGCGGGVGDVDPNLVPVTGTVSVKGSPLSTGSILFTDGTNSYSGLISANGTYEIKASQSASGAKPGSYKVGVTSEASGATMDEAGNPVPAKSNIDAKYNNPETSGLTVDVKADGGPYDFLLE